MKRQRAHSSSLSISPRAEKKSSRRKNKPHQLIEMDDEKLTKAELLNYGLQVRANLGPICSRKKLIDVEKIHEQKPFVCEKCSRRFMSKQGLMQHAKYECMRDPRFECAYCLFKCKRPWVIGAHLKKHHGDQIPQYFDNIEDS